MNRISNITHSFGTFAQDIKLSHSIFALPFAASAILLAKLDSPRIDQLMLLIVAMVSARSYAMGMNRFIDRGIDKENPRTKVRGIPSEKISASASLFWSLFMGGLFIWAAFSLNRLVGYLAPIVLLVLMFYSYWKRFSWFAHWYLGACLGLAPIAVCLALVGSVPAAVILLSIAVMMWTAGFDILYSLQDREFDANAGLKSVPSRFGPRRSIMISRACFVVMIALLIAAGWLSDMGVIYYLGVVAIGVILAYEHFIVREAAVNGKSDKINAAFFNANAYVSVAFFVLTLTDVLVKS